MKKLYKNSFTLTFVFILISFQINLKAQINNFDIPTEMIGDETMLLITNTNNTNSTHRLFRMENYNPAANQDMFELSVDPIVSSQFIEFQHDDGSVVGKINSDGSASFSGLSLGIIDNTIGSDMLSIWTKGTDGIQVTGDDTGDAYIRLRNGVEHEIFNDESTDQFVFKAAANTVTSFRDGNTINMTIDNTGNLGLGTSTPMSKLDIHTFGYDGISVRGDGSNDTYLLIQNGAHEHFLFANQGLDNRFTMQSEATKDLGFNTGQINRMHIEATNGNIGINTASPQMKLHIVHEDLGNDGLLLENAVTGEEWSLKVSGMNDDLQLRHGGVYKGYFDDVSGVYTNISDRRLKNNIKSIETVSNKIMQLNPKQYTFKNSGSDNIYFGLIAQELLEVFPNTVHISAEKNTSSGDIQDLHSVSYTDLIPILIKGFQEQQVQIEKQVIQIEKLQRLIK